MAKPTDLPIWATDGAADVVEPANAKKVLGWVPNERPPAQFFNWWQELVHDWCAYLDNLENEAAFLAGNFNWTGAHDWQAAAHQLRVGSGGQVFMDTGSSLQLNTGSSGQINGSVDVGGNLNLFAGGTMLMDGLFLGTPQINCSTDAEIRIKNGGELIVETGGVQRVEANGEIRVELNGELNMVSSNIDLSAGAEIVTAVGSAIRLGDGVEVYYTPQRTSRHRILNGNIVFGAWQFNVTNGAWTTIQDQVQFAFPIDDHLPQGAVMLNVRALVEPEITNTGLDRMQVAVYSQPLNFTAGTGGNASLLGAVGFDDGTSGSVQTLTAVLTGEPAGDRTIGSPHNNRFFAVVQSGNNHSTLSDLVYGIEVEFLDPGLRNRNQE